MCHFLISKPILIIIEPMSGHQFDLDRIWWVLGYASFVSLYEVQASWEKNLDEIYNSSNVKCLFDMLYPGSFSRLEEKIINK